MLFLTVWGPVGKVVAMAEDSKIKIGPESRKLRFVLICVGLVLATAIAFEPIRANDFVEYDDYQYLVKNRHVQKGVTVDSAIWAFTTFHASNWHPVTWLSHMIDCGLFGLEPLWHHFVNVLLHVCNSLLLFVILRRMTGAAWPSAIVAALFAVHPVHVESVAWAAQRKDVLSAFFWMLTILAYIDYVEKPCARRHVMVFILFCLGLMTKPMVVTLPIILLLLDFWPLRRLNLGEAGVGDKHFNVSCKQSVIRLLLEKIPLFAVAFASMVITYLIQQDKAMATEDFFGFGMRLCNALYSYAAYIGKMFWPAGLAVLYPLRMEGLKWYRPLLGLVVLVVTSAVVIWQRQRRPFLFLGWWWYVITLLPVIGLVQVGVQAMADRYTYLPSIGLFLMVVWSLAQISEKLKIPVLVKALITAIVLTSLVSATRVQVGYWRDNFTLFGRAIDVTENNYIMHNNFGLALANRKRYDEAIEHFEKVLQINPGYIRANANIGFVLRRQEKVDEAIELYKELLKIKPDWPEVHNDLGRAYAYKGMGDEAIECYREALRLRGDFAEAVNNWGMVLKDQGKHEQAMEKFRKAHELLQGR
jgi:tetratricopeptide (TPR) repeat protein